MQQTRVPYGRHRRRRCRHERNTMYIVFLLIRHQVRNSASIAGHRRPATSSDSADQALIDIRLYSRYICATRSQNSIVIGRDYLSPTFQLIAQTKLAPVTQPHHANFRTLIITNLLITTNVVYFYLLLLNSQAFDK